jgi:ribonuclease HII
MSTPVIAGIDEVGRGAVAGPVVACACVFERKNVKVPRRVRIADSKVLTEEERETSFAFLSGENVPYGIGIVEAAIVDAMGILEATERAMQRALQNLKRLHQVTYLLVDGRDHFWFDLPHSSIIGGDRSEPCISAASIIAKVTRDRLMTRSERVFPGYGFGEHKGYGTPAHMERIRATGLCPLHRRSFLGRITSQSTPSGAFSR